MAELLKSEPLSVETEVEELPDSRRRIRVVVPAGHAELIGPASPVDEYPAATAVPPPDEGRAQPPFFRGSAVLQPHALQRVPRQLRRLPDRRVRRHQQ